MTVPLSTNELSRLLTFVGYGVLDAEVWFLGMEEAGGGEDNIRKRLRFRPIEDCMEAHKILGIVKHHWGNQVIQPTWRGMCCIMLGLAGKEPSRENIRAYQANMLGRYRGRTLLTELMPIPKPEVATWGYEQLIPQYPSAMSYYQRVKPQRIALLQKLLSEHAPRVVIAYGKQYWTDYKAIFPNTVFTNNDLFQVGKSNNTLVILTDHFTSRTMNNKWNGIVSIIKKNT